MVLVWSPLMDILGLCGFTPSVLYDSDPMDVGRELSGECMSHYMGVTSAVTNYFRDIEPEKTNSYIQKEPQWSNRDTNLPTKLSTPNFSYLQEMQGQR